MGIKTNQMSFLHRNNTGYTTGNKRHEYMPLDNTNNANSTKNLGVNL